MVPGRVFRRQTPETWVRNRAGIVRQIGRATTAKEDNSTQHITLTTNIAAQVIGKFANQLLFKSSAKTIHATMMDLARCDYICKQIEGSKMWAETYCQALESRSITLPAGQGHVTLIFIHSCRCSAVQDHLVGIQRNAQFRQAADVRCCDRAKKHSGSAASNISPALLLL